MNKTYIYSMLLFIAGIAIGMFITWDLTNVPQEATLSISQMAESIGGAEYGNNITNISYKLFLYNSGVQEMHIVSVEPIFNGKLEQMLASDDLKMPVNNKLQPGSAIEIHSIVDINNTNLSKTDILEMDIVTAGFNVTSVTSCMLAEH
jgi:hypothetical protein